MREGVVVNVGNTTAIDITNEVGNVTETMTVKGSRRRRHDHANVTCTWTRNCRDDPAAATSGRSSSTRCPARDGSRMSAATRAACSGDYGTRDRHGQNTQMITG